MVRKVSVVLVLSICAFAAKKTKEPISVSINAPAEVVKANIVSFMNSAGYRISSDTQFQLGFWQEMTGGSAFFTQMMLGNSYSEKPKREIDFDFSPSGNDTVVTARGEITIKQALGRIDRVDLTQGKARSELIAMLTSIKARSEAQAAGRSSEPSLVRRQDTLQSSAKSVTIAADRQKVLAALKERGKEHGWDLALEGADYIILSHERIGTDNSTAGTYFLRFDAKDDGHQTELSYVLSAQVQQGQLISITEQEQSAIDQNVAKALADIKTALEPSVKQAAF